jgi:hypothetical protein
VAFSISELTLSSFLKSRFLQYIDCISQNRSFFTLFNSFNHKKNFFQKASSIFFSANKMEINYKDDINYQNNMNYQDEINYQEDIREDQYPE